MELPELDRVVSILNQNHEPHAFSVDINQELDSLKIVTLTDITQSLIKRIMVQNNANIDSHSGAYAKQYFSHIMKSYEDGASFNEKITGVLMIELYKDDSFTTDETKEFVNTINQTIRQDDMLVQWERDKFLLAFLADNSEKATQVKTKLDNTLRAYPLSGFSYELAFNFQKNGESIAKLINTLQ